MKQQFSYLVALLLATSSFQAQEVLWEQISGGAHAEFLYDAIPTPDYGFLLAGSSISGKNGNKEAANKGDLDYWIWKMDEKGTAEWQKSFGGSGVDLLQSIAITSEGGFLLGGTSTSNKGDDKKDNAMGLDDLWIIKLDAKGHEIWQRTIGGSGQEKLISIATCRDGGYILGGTSSSSKTEKTASGLSNPYGKTEDSFGSLDYWVVKLSSKGEVQWQKTFGGKYADELKSIITTKDNGFLVGGTSNSPISGNKTSPHFGGADYWVIKIDENGNELWQTTYGGDKEEQLFALSTTLEGGFLIGGNSNSEASHNKAKSNENGTDFWVLKTDAKGLIEWQETYNFGSKDVLASVVANADGTFLIGGYAQTEQKKTTNATKADKEGINDFIALKISATGTVLWTKTVGSAGDEVLRKLFETRDGGYVLAGTTKGQVTRDKQTAADDSDFWMVKLLDKTKKVKEKQDLEAMPNPAVSFTNIIVSYAYTSGTAMVFDLNGRTLQSQTIDGEKTIPIDLTPYPDGIYLIEVKTDVQTNSVKVIKK